MTQTAFRFARSVRPSFSGSDYSEAHDQARLERQYDRIFALMRDSAWRTLSEIEHATGYPTASISAQLRHARKPRFGAHTVNKRARGDRSNGLFEYQLVVREGA